MRAGSDEHEQGEPSYPGGVPNFRKLGFLPIGVAGGHPMGHGEEAIRAVCERLDRPAHLVDAEGYEREITAGAVHPEKDWIAWVEYCCKERRARYLDIEFRLKAQADGREAIDWIVETYNPFFGCRVGYMAWHGERVVIIYREKHETYACSLSATGGRRELVEIADQWAVVGDQITSCSDEPDFVERFALPDLRRLARISSTEAREGGVLPPGYDRANEVNRKIRAMAKRKKPRFWPF